MAAVIADLDELLKDIPSGAWVAISEEKHIVVSYGADAQEVLKQAKERGEKSPLLVRVPDPVTAVFF